MKTKPGKFNYGECEICDAKMVEKRIKQDFWIRGKIVVIDNVPAGVCPHCCAKVVRSEIGKRLATIIGNGVRPWNLANPSPLVTNDTNRTCEKSPSATLGCGVMEVIERHGKCEPLESHRCF